MTSKISNPDTQSLSQQFLTFAESIKRNYDTIMLTDPHGNAKILKSAWSDVCMAGVSLPKKKMAFNNPGSLSLVILQNVQGYIRGQMDIDELRANVRYLDHLTEDRAMREYMSSFLTHIDQWSVHVDAAYVYCKLYVCGVVSRLLKSDEPKALERCDAIDNYVLTQIQSRRIRSNYVRLAANKKTFASVTSFCTWAIDTMRDNQEYLCKLIEFIDDFHSDESSNEEVFTPVGVAEVKIEKSPDSADPINVPDRDVVSPNIRTPHEILMNRYSCTEFITIARAFHIDLHDTKAKSYIIGSLIGMIGDRAIDKKFIAKAITEWRARPRINRPPRRSRWL